MDQSGRSSSPKPKSTVPLDDLAAQQRARLRAELPSGWAFDVAVEAAADLIEPLARHARLRAVLLAMLSNLSEDRSLEAAAKIVSLVPKSFSRLFADETGFCFCSWDSKVRIRIAAYLARESDWSIGSIGEAVGYANPTTFGRAFKRWHGIAARVYRRSRELGTKSRVRATARRARARKRKDR